MNPSIDESEMIAVHSLTAVLATEALIVLFCLLLWLLYRSRRQEKRDRGQARAWVSQFSAHDAERLNLLGEELAELDGVVDKDSLNETVDEVRQRERLLYCVVIDAFLTRDVAKLASVEEKVGSLSEPWRLLARRLAEAAADAGDDDDPRERLAALDAELQQARGEVDAAAKELELARAEREDLAQRLDRAIAALDQVSGEYAKMFGDAKSAEELRASRERLLRAFRAAERSIGAPADATAGDPA